MARNRARRPVAAARSRSAPAARAEDADAALVSLVGDWLSLPEVAERCGYSPAQVRHMLAENELRALRVDGGLRVPESFLVGEHGSARSLPDLRGTLTVLDDAGFGTAEGVRWLFTADESLLEGRPIDTLRAGRKTEIRRRAQALAL